jgi:hypothetical protein
MLGDRKTLPFWRQRRPNFLALGRILKSRSPGRERHTGAELVVIRQMVARRRFEESKGKIHPPV